MRCNAKKPLKLTVLSLISLFLLLFLSIPSHSSILYVSGQNFGMQFVSGQSLGFQSGNVILTLDVTTGNLTSSITSLVIYNSGGQLNFKSNETHSFKLTFPDEVPVKVKGDQNNQLRAVSSGSIFNVNVNDTVTILWDIMTDIWLPIPFILGMLGLVAMVGGSMWTVHELKENKNPNYHKILVNGTVTLCIGVALVLTWLWS